MTSNEQARSDAIADAETLRLFWRQHGTYRETRYGLEWEPFTPKLGTCADYLLHNSTRPVFVGGEARAAFRAVPGLRGWE